MGKARIISGNNPYEIEVLFDLTRVDLRLIEIDEKLKEIEENKKIKEAEKKIAKAEYDIALKRIEELLKTLRQEVDDFDEHKKRIDEAQKETERTRQVLSNAEQEYEKIKNEIESKQSALNNIYAILNLENREASYGELGLIDSIEQDLSALNYELAQAEFSKQLAEAEYAGARKIEDDLLKIKEAAESFEEISKEVEEKNNAYLKLLKEFKKTKLSIVSYKKRD